MKLWIARNKNNDLNGFESKPIRDENSGEFVETDGIFYSFDFELFPDVLWYNSPQMIELKLIQSKEK